MNGTVRGRDDEGEDTSPKRTRPVTVTSTVEHYDIYLLPTLPGVPFTPSHHSAAFAVVNNVSGLAGLGSRYCLEYSLSPTPSLASITDPSFFLPREQASYDPTRVVLLGWIHEDRLGYFEGLVRSVGVPAWRGTGEEVGEWVVEVARKLEYEGVLSNPELLMRRIMPV